MARRRFFRVLAFAAAFTTVSACAVAAEDPFAKLVAKRQFTKAAAVVAKSARKGNPLSQYRYAVLLRNGLGVKRNESEARDWLRKSSAAGNSDAAMLLRRLSNVVISDTISATPQPSKRFASIASIAGLAPRPADGPTWTALIASRAAGTIDVADSLQTRSRDAAGETPLIAAIRSGNRKIAKDILDHGGDPNAADQRGFTALHWASIKTSPELVTMLLSAGAETQSVNKSGETAALLAAKSCHAKLLGLIVEHHRTNTFEGDGKSVGHVLVQNCDDPTPYVPLLDAAAPSETDGLGRSLLWYAAERNKLAWVKFLLTQKVSVSATDTVGSTPLHVASAKGHQAIASMLLGSDADTNAVDARGNTPLMLAAAGGHASLVSLLLPSVADINQKNVDGETALLLAVKSGNVETIRALVEAGASLTSRSISRDSPEKIIERFNDPVLTQLIK